MSYLENGHEVEKVDLATENLHAVRDLFKEGCGEVFLVKQVFDNPPTIKLDQTILAKKGEIARLQDKIKELKGEIVPLEERLERLKKHPDLLLLEDFLEGKITHYVVKDYHRIKILQKEETESDEGLSYQTRPLRLLRLYGRPDRSLEWYLNRYADGSGSETYVYPATSLEAAQEKAKELTEQLLRNTEGNPRQEIIATAEAFGVPVSENYRKAFSELRREANKRRRQTLLQELEKITLEEVENVLDV